MPRSRKLSIVVLILLIVGGSAYTALWMFVAKQISLQIDNIWVAMADGGAVIVGDKPKPEGFPAPPAVVFRGVITEANGTVWNLPEFRYSGFPVPGFRMKLDMPQGLTVSGPVLPQPVEFQDMRLYILLPYNLPHNESEAAMRAWQEAGGTIPIEHLFVKSGELLIQGQGAVGLDKNLQIAGDIATRIVGMDALLADLSEKGVIKGQSAVMAQSFLQMLIQRDPATGITYFDTVIRIQNRGVFLGPLRVGSLPELSWSNDSPPVPHQ